MKKLFSFMLILLLGAGLFGLPAIPLHPGGDNAPLIFMPQENMATFTAPGTPAPMRLTMTFAMDQKHEAAFAQAVDLICLWSDQYRQGLLTQDEFKTLVAGRIVIAFRDYFAISHLKAGTEGMRSLAKKTRTNVDRLLIYRELELGIQRPTSLTPGGEPKQDKDYWLRI
jgi:hypothetical protein